MKKQILTTLFALGCLVMSYAQTTLYYETFNSTIFPANMTRINQDGLTPYYTGFGTDAWILWLDSISPTLNDTVAASTSWYSPAGVSNDWMITPQITLGASNNVLSWNASSSDSDPTYQDGYQVRIGTSPTIAAMTTVLYTTPSEPNVWAAHSVNIPASFNGQAVYIAFVNNFNDGNLLFIDDIRVVGGAASVNDIGLTASINPSEYTSIPLSQAQSGSFNVGVSVNNAGNQPATGVAVNLVVRNLTSSTVVNTQTLTGSATIAAGSTSAFTGTGVPYAGVGFYEFRYICSMTPLDANRTNDTIYRYVAIDAQLYARDNAILFGTITNVLGVPGNTVEVAQKYNINNITGVTLDTVFAFINEKRVGARYRAKLYIDGGTGPSVLAATSLTRTITTTDTVGGVGILGIVFSPTLVPPATGSYFMAIEQMDTFNMGLGYVSGLATANAAYIKIGTGAWATSSTLGFAGSYIIWPQLKTAAVCNLAVTATGSNPTCGLSNGGVTTTVTGATSTPTYLWSTGATTANLTARSAGTYTVTVTSASCTATATATLTNVGTPPSVTVSTTPSNCASNTGTATANGAAGGATYSWSTNPVQNTMTATGLAAGTYTVTVSLNGCSATATGTIINPAPPTFTTTSTPSACASTTGTASANGAPAGSTYAWSTSPTQNTATASNLAAGSYTVTVTNNGCTASASVVVTNPNAPVASATGTNPLCFGGVGSALASATGGTGTYGFTWSTTPVQNTAAASSLAAGTYTVTVRDAASCAGVANVTIVAPSQITLTLTNSAVNCFGGNTGTATVVATGGTGTLNYSWNTAPAQTTTTATGLLAGTYSVTVRDANQCTVSASTQVSQPSTALSGTASASPVNCFGGNTGTATVVGTGGTPNYSYVWSNAQNTAAISGLAAGSFTVTITDSKSCTATASATVSQPTAALTVTTTKTANTATAVVSGGTPTYTYSWNTTPAQTTATATGLTAGTFSVTVTDSKGCTASTTVVLSSIKDIASAGFNTLAIYPNPTTSYFTIKADLIESSAVSIEIVDIKGQLVAVKDLGFGMNIEEKILIDMLSAGVYTVKVKSATGIATQKLIIQ